MNRMFLRHRKSRRANLPFWRQRGWQLSAAFIALTVLGSSLSFLRSTGETADLNGVAAGTLNVAQPACPPGNSGNELPTAAPPDLKWMKLAGSAVPTAQ